MTHECAQHAGSCTCQDQQTQPLCDTRYSLYALQCAACRLYVAQQHLLLYCAVCSKIKVQTQHLSEPASATTLTVTAACTYGATQTVVHKHWCPGHRALKCCSMPPAVASTAQPSSLTSACHARTQPYQHTHRVHECESVCVHGSFTCKAPLLRGTHTLVACRHKHVACDHS